MTVYTVDDRRHVEPLRQIAVVLSGRDVVDMRRRRRVVVVAVDAADAVVLRRADVGVVHRRVGEVVAVPAAAVHVAVDLDDAEPRAFLADALYTAPSCG